jgi:hypothetical protein
MTSAAVAAQCRLVGRAAGNAAMTLPVVDRLSVKVLTDSSYDTPPASASKWVKVRRVGLSAAGDYRKTLHNEWGLALALESQAGNTIARTRARNSRAFSECVVTPVVEFYSRMPAAHDAAVRGGRFSGRSS